MAFIMTFGIILLALIAVCWPVIQILILITVMLFLIITFFETIVVVVATTLAIICWVLIIAVTLWVLAQLYKHLLS